ncbi:MAG: RagB/SusD family nutrient uptake outer membrane protein, partial [Bacteroidales bacterium]|nr:RagB/SusD family nutrient uptake outer membrane protein [Bacteroidales bacterium]
MRKALLFGMLFLLSFTSCNDWLELYPENAQVSSQYWETKADVEAVLAAGYVRLRGSVDKLFVWGEVRGNGVMLVNINKDDNTRAAQRIRSMDILPSNLYAKWGEMYQVINIANSVIKYGPEVVEMDDSFTNEELNSFLSEAYFLRSLAYFYLVRTFRDVPYITQPYVNDDERFEVEKISGDLILDYLVEDLEKSRVAAKEFFPELDNEYQMNTKGRVTKWTINALLADIYLWQGNYEACISACDHIVASGRVGLISNWFLNFFPGNSNESIFEIQYSYDRGQTNSFAGWFDVAPKYLASIATVQLFNETQGLGDVRGENGSFLLGGQALGIWKYMGLDYYDISTAKRSSIQNDQNYIVYRLADVLLMKAEALVMTENYEEAIGILNQIRARAGIEGDMNPAATEFEMLQLVMKERQRELVAEGKRWFDLLRVAKRDDYRYLNYLIEEVTSVVPLSSLAIVSSKLMNTDSHYLPIHQDELNANRLLI